MTERLLACAKQGAGEDHAVEGDIVLGHELPVLNLLGILPPQLPVACVLGRDTDVPDRSIKPHIEYLKVIKKFRTYHACLGRSPGCKTSTTRFAASCPFLNPMDIFLIEDFINDIHCITYKIV